ncbi:MAG: hypothetical protein IPK67_01860 [Planctomycetes bacterium]|nr:hypothetical protein [Planctomycetota bacterium]
MQIKFPLQALAVLSLAPLAAAQGSPFQTPGMPRSPQAAPPAEGASGAGTGQADRFTSGFNPAFSFIVDALGEYTQFSDSTETDGVAMDLRILELASQAWVDPSAWAYFVGATDGEALAIEEAAVHYKGFGGNRTLRVGRFFIDFGKQMQVHPHELRTVDRPLALRAYLGEEVKGDGLQWDSWAPLGDETAVRWSFGAFKSLLPEEAAFANTDGAGEPITYSAADRKDVEDLNFTARVTGFRDVGERGVLQLGASLRALPDYEAADSSGLTRSGLSNNVFGADATYGLSDETGQKRLTLGTEVLLNTGDTAAVFADPDNTPNTGDEFLDRVDDPGLGLLAFADYAWSRSSSAGVQYSQAELPDGNETLARELEVYYTRALSEFHRVRFAVTAFDSETDSDSLRFAIQYTAFVGAHGHGVNW